jgi:hypothetical protein
MDQSLFCRDGSPLTKPEDLIPFLADEKQWREGRSACETAYSWFDAKGIPQAVAAVIKTDPTFSHAILVKAVFEKQTELDSLGRPSQTDVLALLQLPTGPAILGVEAKVDESFGPRVADWDDGSPGKTQRLAGLVERLGLDKNAVGHLRYQLLHRTVATLIEAERHNARDCAMIVQSFCAPPRRAGFTDFQAFAAALSIPIDQPGKLSRPLERGGIILRLGWAEDRIRVQQQ